MDRPEISEHRRRKQRSRRGCLTCRSRKVKCDEQEHGCKNCARLKLKCVWGATASSSLSTQRSRKSRACQRCREKKLRCSPSDVAGLCNYCRQSGVRCINASESPCSQQTPSSLPAAVLTTAGDLPEGSQLLGLLDAYFEGPHNFCFYTFIHPPTFRQMLDNSLVPRSLLLIVLATSLRCLEPRNVLADSWADECRNLVMKDIFSRISTTNLQALLLLQRYEWHRGAHISAWFIAALATRLAQTLQLNDEPSVNQKIGERMLPVTVMETRRRLIWSCFVMDSIPDAGARPLSAAFDPASIKAKLPCDERSYYLGVESCAGHLATGRSGTDTRSVDSFGNEPQLGVSAFVVKLTMLRMQILQYSSSYHPRNRLNLPSEAPWEPNTLFYQYQRSLDSWSADLPNELDLDSNSHAYDNSKMISLFTLHCMFHAAYADLCRVGSFVKANNRDNQQNVFLNPPSTFLQLCRRGRLENAFKITGIAAKCLTHLKTEPDPFVAICGCLAVRVLVIERRPDDNDYLLSEEDVRNRIDEVVRCVKKTAQWSKPVWKMLLAVSELTSQHGYQVDLTGIPSLSCPEDSRPISRAASPSLRTYGTYGTIQRSLATEIDGLRPDPISNAEYGDRPLQSTPSDAFPAVVHTTQNPDSSIGRYNEHSEPLSPQTLQLESSWADGTYDRALTEAQFDWPDGNFGLDTNYDWIYYPFDSNLTGG